MTATATQKKLAAMEAEMRDIMRQINTLPASDPKHQQLMDRGRSIVPKARALRLSLHIGEQVKRRVDWCFNRQLTGRTGTLLEVRRTKCDVDYGDLGVWTMPIANVIPADASHKWGGEY